MSEDQTTQIPQASSQPPVQPTSPPQQAPLKPQSEEVLPILTIDTEGRLTEEKAMQRFNVKFPRDPSRRILLPAQTRPDKKGKFEYIDVFAQNMPANEKYPNGMFCSFYLKAKAKTHMDHRGLVIAVKASDIHLDQEGFHKVENTAIEIVFVSGVLVSAHAQSVDVARFLYQHPMHGLMWGIDEFDPGGFWRSVGVVEEYTATHTRMRTAKTG